MELMRKNSKNVLQDRVGVQIIFNIFTQSCNKVGQSWLMFLHLI